MKKTISLLVFIFLLSTFLTTALAQKSNNETDPNTLAELIEKADQVFNSRQYVQSREWYQKAADLAESEGDSSYATEANVMLARTYLLEDEREEGQKYLVKAIGTASPDHPLGWSRYLGVRGRFEWHDKRLEKATETFKEMYFYCSTRKMHDRAVDAAHMVAITGSFEEQVEWAQKGIKEAEEGNVTGWLGPLWNNLGATYEDLEDYEKALEAYKYAREYHHKYGQEINKLIADWALGHAYRLNDDIHNAERYLKPLLKKFDDLNDIEFMGWTYKELGEIEIVRKNYKGAVEYLYLARNNLRDAGMKEWDPEGYAEFMQLIEDTKKNDMRK